MGTFKNPGHLAKLLTTRLKRNKGDRILPYQVLFAFDLSGSSVLAHSSDMQQGVRDFIEAVDPTDAFVKTYCTFDMTILHVGDLVTNRDMGENVWKERGGDTLIEIPFKYGEDVDVIVVFTDGYFKLPAPPEDQLVIWIMIGDNTAYDQPWGEVILFNPQPLGRVGTYDACPECHSPHVRTSLNANVAVEQEMDGSISKTEVVEKLHTLGVTCLECGYSQRSGGE